MMHTRTFLIVALLLSCMLNASERPKIGLVLSGGGARGAAHVGVIKLLEEKNIPIDAIVGTSMGSLVGGLYASGMSIDEVESFLRETDWKRYVAYSYERRDNPIRRKNLEHDFPSEIKVGIDKDENILLPPGLFKRHKMVQLLERTLRHVSNQKDFDKLRIPYRAVASDLETGEKVVLNSGSLAESIYASIAIPGGFEPIVIENKTLIDGGVADNLPVDVMRKMGVDIIIAVDISTPFTKDPKFNSYIDIMSQLSDILMRKNVEHSIASMKTNEILITPDLSGYTPLDSDKYTQIIEIGYASAKEAYTDKLSALSVDDKTYLSYQSDTQVKKLSTVPVVDEIRLENLTYLSNKTILGMIHIQKGRPLDYRQLDEDIKSIYNLMVFDDVTYRLSEEEGKTVLHIHTTPKWDVNGQLRFAFGFEDNFDGHSDYSAMFEYIMFGLNSYGGEWRNRFSIGIRKLILSELYQPLDPGQTFYIKPSIFYRDNKVYVSPSLIGGHTVSADLDDSIPVQARESGGALGLGMNIKRSVQLETGIEAKEVKPSMDLFYVSPTQVSYNSVEARQKVVMGYVDMKIDTLDKAFFPDSGVLAEGRFIHQLPKLGSENEYDQASMQIKGVTSYKDHTLIRTAKYGTTYNTTDFEQIEDFNAYYTLGGLFNISGLPTNALTGDNVAFGSLNYRYKLKKDDFFGPLSVPLYAGMSLEAGKAWYEESKLDIPQERRLHAGSLYLGADTILGPFFFGLGATEGGYYSIYLTLGQGF